MQKPVPGMSGVVCFSLVLWLLAASVLPAQQPAPAAKHGPQNKEFDQVFGQWKALLAEMRQLKEEHGKADSQRRSEIEKQYQELVDKGVVMEAKLIETSEKAYAEAPNTNPELTEFLVAILRGETRRDEYEHAFEVGHLLAKNQCNEPGIYNWAGIAAFAVGRFDEAETYLKQTEASGAIDEVARAYLRQIPQYKQAWAKEEPIRAAEAKADDLPRVLLKTTKGDIELELFENEAPNTVANFISLVEKGFYNGLVFHRVLPGFMAQGGCPKGDGTGGPGYSIPCECHQQNARLHFRGSLSMAHAGRDTGGSQFFVTFVPTAHLNNLHTCLGRVVKGMEVLAKLQRRDPAQSNPPKPDKILEAKVLRKRNHPYVPKKTGE